MRTTWTLLALLALATAASAQDGGKIPWKGRESGDPKPAMAEAKRQSKPMMLFFTSVG